MFETNRNCPYQCHFCVWGDFDLNKIRLFDFDTVVEEFRYLFKKSDGYVPILKANIVKKKFSLGKSKEKININSALVKHGKIKSLIYVFNKTAYISDSNDLSIINLNLLKNLNYLILDCLRFRKHPSHFNLEEALYVSKCLKAKKTILTNLHYDMDYDYLLKILPKNVIPAYDGLSLKL